MINVAVLGYGTIGSGVVEVLQTNTEVIAKRAGEEVSVKYILDLRDFPGDVNEDKVVHDYGIIEKDEDIQIVVECMGGVEPAYTFVKKALLQGRGVATSNKELVAKYGAELIEIADEKNTNFLFEASVGGGIPILRPLISSLTADVVEKISGILNGTTNYMLTRMEEAGISFEEALKEAQEKGYAELHPEADVEGYDACRKIAILSSLAYGQQVDYEDIYTEGITKITAEDIRYAAAMGKSIKLLGSSMKKNGKYYAMVCPMLIDNSHPLSGVKDVFNAIFVHGNMVDDTMFYGKGAGKLPTASAVAADVVACVKHKGEHISILWDRTKLPLSDISDFERKYFVRMPVQTDWERIHEAFGQVEPVAVDGLDEKAFITGVMKEKDFNHAILRFECIINRIRLD
ncbi:MAG: homoserine dehydrogenase [Lachnospiraceae bacterium]|nr:homoserine dehydrogenase [Lachnospiraceae bacterium]MDY5497818.1 homoserine dehydrogenase [Anaerobutyricum sp.]